MTDHTLQDDFEHFLAYTSGVKDPMERLRLAYEHGNDRTALPVPVRAPQGTPDETFESLWNLFSQHMANFNANRDNTQVRAEIDALLSSRLGTGALPAIKLPTPMEHKPHQWQHSQMEGVRNSGFCDGFNRALLEVAEALAATPPRPAPAPAPAEPLTTKEIADLTAMVWGAPVADNDLKLAEVVIRAHEEILKTGERPKDPVDGGRYIEVPGAFGEGT